MKIGYVQQDIDESWGWRIHLGLDSDVIARSVERFVDSQECKLDLAITCADVFYVFEIPLATR